jgi:hypothetical protein
MVSCQTFKSHIRFLESGERGAKSAGTGLCPVLSCLAKPSPAETLRERQSRGARAAVSPFLTGNPSKGEPQVEHLFKTAGSD